jgi:hypothetical protein
MERGSQARSRTEDVSQTSICYEEEARRPHILRKPVPTRIAEEPQSKQGLLGPSDNSQDASNDLTKSLKDFDLDGETPALPLRPYPSIDATALSIDNSPSRSNVYEAINTASSLSPSTSTSNALPSPTSSLSTASSYTQKAYREARHFVGGLIHHPSQNTKHISILRHSHGLVFYHGPTTSIALSIFAAAPLPPTRTLWLQPKGWTGKAGMRARALTGRTATWLDVTPSTRLTAEQLNPHDERAWQRDIASFIKRAAGTARAKHALRETAVVRVPSGAGDGYYRVVLCAGATKREVLCSSPVFRVLSVSTRPGSIRGASLGTLPLEVGARVLGSSARAAVKASVGNAVAPVAAAVQQRVRPYKPSWTTEMAARAAYDLSGMSKRVDSDVQDAGVLYDQKRNEAFGKSVYEDLPNDGPNAPYPVKFIGNVDCRSRIAEDFDVPITYLRTVPEDILHQLN